jgi:hypothetical protein
MVRRRWLIAQVVLAGVLALLAFPGESSAFAGMPIALTATGPVPAIQTVSTVTYPFWINQDTVAHTVSFANGRCTVQVAPGGLADCPTGFASGPGDYAYTVDGTAQASVVVQIAGRTVTLGARTHQIAGGARLTLARAPHLLRPVAGPWPGVTGNRARAVGPHAPVPPPRRRQAEDRLSERVIRGAAVAPACPASSPDDLHRRGEHQPADLATGLEQAVPGSRRP